MKDYLLLLLVMILLGQYCYGQEHDEDNLFKKFKRDIQIEMEEHGGRVRWDNETRESYYLLVSTYPIDSLVKYTDDSIPVVRSEVFVGLAQKNVSNKVLLEILNRHKNDTAKFISGSTDVMIPWKVNEYMQMVLDLKTDNKLPSMDYKERLEKLRNDNAVILKGAHHGIIPKDSLSEVENLIYSKKDYKIISFSLYVKEKEFKASSCIWTKQMKEAIKELDPGEKIYISEIVAELPDKSRVRLGSITLKIK